MPILNDSNMNAHKVAGSSYGFSAKRIEHLGASEYTLVSIAADVSGSVSVFKREIEKCVKEIVRACRHSPRADNLMMRFTTFDSNVTEVHGFRPLNECDEDKYEGTIRIGGMTALYDATHNAVVSATTYGKDLTDHDFDVNSIAFVITDGGDNASVLTVKDLNKALARAVTSEAVESMVSILVGVNVADPTLSQYLEDLKDEAGFSQYVELSDAKEKTLAKLATFVSRSISAQSQALGSGAATAALTF